MTPPRVQVCVCVCVCAYAGKWSEAQLSGLCSVVGIFGGVNAGSPKAPDS